MRLSREDYLDQQRKGQEAEAVARDYLAAHGMEILCENFKCKRGELDIVALHHSVLIVVEVRMRSERDFGGAAESITLSKRQSIIRATKYLLLKKPELRPFPVRFDVVTLDGPSALNPTGILWMKDAFQAKPRD